MQDTKGDNRQGGQTPPTQGGLSWSSPTQTPVPPARQSPAPASAPAQKSFAAPKAPPLKTTEKQASSPTKYAGMIALGIVAGVIIAWGWAAVRVPTASAPTTNTTANSGTAASGAEASTSGAASDFGLAIKNPQVAGNSVTVEKAVISSPTWIVVYENNSGKPGNALGAALFFPENKGGTVELLRGTLAGRSYLATLQVDNGDRKFSLKDDQFLAIDGAAQWVTFEVK